MKAFKKWGDRWWPLRLLPLASILAIMAITLTLGFSSKMILGKKKAFILLKAFKKWGDRWDSNPRQPESQSGALPTELRSPQEPYF